MQEGETDFRSSPFAQPHGTFHSLFCVEKDGATRETVPSPVRVGAWKDIFCV